MDDSMEIKIKDNVVLGKCAVDVIKGTFPTRHFTK